MRCYLQDGPGKHELGGWVKKLRLRGLNKFIAVFLALAFLLTALSACSDDEVTPTATPEVTPTASATPPSGGEYKVYMPEIIAHD